MLWEERRFWSQTALGRSPSTIISLLCNPQSLRFLICPVEENKLTELGGLVGLINTESLVHHSLSSLCITV